MSENKETPAVQNSKDGIVDAVLSRITDLQTQGELMLPGNYSAENAVRSAYLIILEVADINKKPALEVCTPASVANAMLDMVLQGLNPVKKQCYFIVYGNKLQMSRSYIGTVSVAKRIADVKEPNANVIYLDDEFEYEINSETGRKRVVKHIQHFANIDNAKIIGAYATIVLNDGSTHTEIMTKQQIEKAWSQRKGQGLSPAHEKFPDEMSKKTVISRALKMLIGSTDDSVLFEDYEPAEDVVSAGVKHEIAVNGNKKPISIDKGMPKAEVRIPKEELAEVAETQSNHTEDGPGY